MSSRASSASPDARRGTRLSVLREAATPSFAQDQLTPEQYNAAQRFSLRVFGEPMFFSEPVCNGKHGWGCLDCHPVLLERQLAARRRPVAQPWDASRIAA